MHCDSLPSRRPSTGFSLIELMAVLAIMAVLALLAVPVAQVQLQRIKEHELRLALREIRGAIDAYQAAAMSGRVHVAAGASGYPPSLEALVDGVEDRQDPRRRRLYFLRRIPRDPMSNDGSLQPAQTWRLRSYASAPDDPQPGDDVYDVLSASEAIGLNGVPYARW